MTSFARDPLWLLWNEGNFDTDLLYNSCLNSLQAKKWCSSLSSLHIDEELASLMPPKNWFRPFSPITVFENHRKSRIQYCEWSELRFHFDWTKVHWNAKIENSNATFWVILIHCVLASTRMMQLSKLSWQSSSSTHANYQLPEETISPDPHQPSFNETFLFPFAVFKLFDFFFNQCSWTFFHILVMSIISALALENSTNKLS